MGFKTRVKGSPNQIGNKYKERESEYPYGAKRRGSGKSLPPQNRSVDSMKKPGASMKGGKCASCGKAISYSYPGGLCHSCAKKKGSTTQPKPVGDDGRTVQEVRLYRAEGKVGDPALGRWMSFSSVEDANEQLRKNQRTMPETQMGYDKHDYVIIFKDGSVYKGRYDLTRREAPDLHRDVIGHSKFIAEDPRAKQMEWITERDRKVNAYFLDLMERDQQRKGLPKKIKKASKKDKTGITRVLKDSKPQKHRSLEDLKADRDMVWRCAKRIEEKEPDPKVREKRLNELWDRYYSGQPDMKPLIYRTSIGHYGGLYVEVPEEHFEKFKAQFPSREFPRRVRTVDVREDRNIYGEQRFRQRFPNSNKIKEVYFNNGSKGEKRMEYMRMPIPE